MSELRLACYDHYGSVATFIPKCPNCGRFVKAGNVYINGLDEIRDENNAVCSRCGEITMEFEGWLDSEELE